MEGLARKVFIDTNFDFVTVSNIGTLPIHDVRYEGREKRASAALWAPAGTTLDGGDIGYCKSRKFKRTESPFGKAPSGICW